MKVSALLLRDVICGFDWRLSKYSELDKVIEIVSLIAKPSKQLGLRKKHKCYSLLIKKHKPPTLQNFIISKFFMTKMNPA